MALIVATVALAASGVWAYLIAFVLPGHLIYRLFRRNKAFGFEGALLSVALSVALLPPFALALNYFGPLTPFRWGAGLLTICAGAALLSVMRRGGRAPAASGRNPAVPSASVWGQLRSVFAKSNFSQLARVEGAALLISAAFAIAQHGALGQRQFAYTELWMLPSDQGGEGRVTFGIRNQEQTPTSYSLEVTLNGALVKRWTDLSIDDGGELVEEVSLPVSANRDQSAEAKLYRSDRPSVLYRHVVLRLPDFGFSVSRR